MESEFREMISPSEADAALAAAMPRYSQVTLPLSRAQGRVLREPIRADRSQPPYDRVAMDGIAFSLTAWQRGQRRFAIQGEQRAGEPAKKLKSDDSCMEVMTGAVLPMGADCVAPVEDIRVEEGFALLDDAAGAPVRYRHVHRAGVDCAVGETLVPEGVLLTAAHIGAAAAFGMKDLKVTEPPSVAIVATGDELVDVGSEPMPHQIRKSNPFAIEAALRKRRIERVAMLHSRDDKGRLRSCLEGLRGKCDVLILTGGVSMGKTDYVPGVLLDQGVRPLFHKIRQKPGKPFWFGVGANGMPVFALPGNPASVLVCLHRYVLPALGRALGWTGEESVPAALEQGMAAPGKLAQFRPVICAHDEEGRLSARWVDNQGSGDFSAWSRADGFVEIPAGEEEARPGRRVRFWRW
ncbi:MAG TPA: molybdopterin molybdotransferase MoeA [Fibrobacteria bacterium]|nr:molybdopterin molybdotransferase MoeA [Fibrobacteria bacterium]